MAAGIGAAGILGVAREVIHAVAGNATVEGDIEFEVTPETLVYFLYGMRGDVTKAGAGPWTYSFSPTSIGQKSATLTTLSITIVRNDIVFAYTQCVVGSLELTVDDGIFMATVSILAKDESTESAPTAVWPTAAPIGAGQYKIEIPTAAQVFDVDGFTFTVNDSAEHAYRLRDDGRGAQFTKFGERTVELTFDRDFDSKTDYDAFKALTAQAIHFHAESATGDHVDLIVHTAIKDTYEVGLDGQGDLVRAQITYQGIWNASQSESFVLEVSSTTEDIT